MAELQVTLTAEERQYLLELLEVTLKEMRIEEHRTRTPSYRQHVLHQEALAQGLVTKLQPSPRPT
jgi:biotin carboxylase